ncbi:MAG: (d)CMP kinase [Firmicutes bacterium]|jgi:cytidylate kinase|nr:(d)CMP kinase [Bacillota bacterium]
MQIAIDGPAGAGKSSVAREVARRLAFKCLDTGAMYRAVTLQALKKGIDLSNGKLLVELVRSCKLEAEYNDQEGTLIYLDGENVTAEIRSPLVNQNVSVVAKSPELRRELVFLQRELADKSNGIVMEGRDIGTNVLVNADYKFFLTASPDERTRRRWLEMRAKGLDVSFEELYKEIALRDRIDQEREEAPLKIAPEALVIDTTPYTLEEVVEKVLSVIRKGKPKERGEEKVK